VALSQGTAYRVEVVPSEAVLSVQSHQQPAAPVRIFQEREITPRGGSSWLLLPPASGEYRLLVSGTLQPATVRIERAPDQQRLLDGTATPVLSALSLGVRAVSLGSMELIRSATAGTLGADSSVTGAMRGAEACLGLKTGWFRPAPALGGCLFTVGHYRHAGGGALTLVGVAPTWRVASTAVADLAIAGNIALGSARQPYRREPTYLVAGFGLGISRIIGPVAIEVTPGVSLARRSAFSTLTAYGNRPVEGVNTIVPRLSFGLHLAL
jgi:hypothetical protein